MEEYYGNNDWRDYLAHYGVKGMKWKKHKYITGENGHYTYQLGNFVSRFGSDSNPTNRWGYRTTGRYVTVGKNNQLRVNLTKTTNKRQGKTWYSGFTSAGATKDGSTKSKRIGRLTFTRDEDGTSVEYEKKSKSKRRAKKTSAKQLISSLKDQAVGYVSKKKADYEYKRNFAKGSKAAQKRYGAKVSKADQQATMEAIQSIRQNQKKMKKRKR